MNEDSVFAGARLFVVADGMGGHAAGGVASAIVVARLSQLAERDDLRPADVHLALAEANREILAAAKADPAQAGMGTTVAGLGLIQVAGIGHWVVFNIGDSRVYRFVDDALVQVTVDHSEVAEMVTAGAIDAEQARTHPLRNVITRALGVSPPPEADVWVFPPTPGERFLLCSDGLFSELTDPEIAAVLRAEPSAQPAADALVRRAVEAGGRDNVTVVLVDHLAAAAATPDDHAREDTRDTLPRGAGR